MSDTYYVKAYHNQKHINIPVEEKHQYYENTESFKIAKPSTIDGSGYSAAGTHNDIALLFSSNWLNFERGTDSDDYIGNKIQLRSLDLTTAMFVPRATQEIIYENFNGYAPVYEGSEGGTVSYRIPNTATLQNKIWAKFRFMVVQFDDKLNGDANSKATSTIQNIKDDIKNWFFNTYIYYPATSGKYRQSVHQNKMRESGTWTGKFKILYDSKMSISANKPLQFEKLISINKNVNIDTGHITHESVKNIYFFIIPPCFNDLDASFNVNSYLAGISNNDLVLATILANMKITYYDL